MDLEIVAVQRQGGSSAEHVHLSVLADCDLTDYLLCDTTLVSGTNMHSNKWRHVYRLPRLAARQGDEVIVRTGTGGNLKRIRADGSTLYIVYWGLEAAVWNDHESVVLLVKIAAISAKRVKAPAT